MALLVAAAGAALGEEPSAPATARVTYLTGASAYVDAGREEGVREGDTLEVVREGRVVATLRITAVSAHRASGAVENATTTLVVGDLVRYTPRRASTTDAAAPPTAEPGSTEMRSPPGRKRGPGFRGRVGMRYAAVRDRSGNGNGFSQPALDVRLDGYALGGGPLDLVVDARARRTYRTSPEGAAETEGRTRLYRYALTYRLRGERHRITVGRQFAPALAGLSIFDGVLYSADGERWGGGVFAGLQPDPSDLGFSADIQEYGGYVVVHGRPQAPRRWSLTTGIVGSYTRGTVNREFLYVQAHYHGPRLSGFMSEEVDYNREWKASEAGEPTFSATGGFVSLQLRAGENVTLFGGYDGRRNVRLYRDRVNPAIEFDDSYRQGAWGGVSLRFAERFQVAAEGRTSHGGAMGNADAYSMSFRAGGFTRVLLEVQARSTRYTNSGSEGWLHALGAGVNLGSRSRLELSGGSIEETSLVDPSMGRSQKWFGLDLDLGLGRGWYLSLSAERNEGSSEKNDQV